MSKRYRQIVGWGAVGLSTLASCFWAFWGSIENFHEGWYHDSFAMNLGMMVSQYLLPMLLFTAAAVVGIRWPRLGAGIHFVAALWAAWRFRGAAPLGIYASIVGPLAVMGVGYWFGRPDPKRRAVAGVILLPRLTALICGAEPAWRVAGRVNDGDFFGRRLTGNGVDLVWAPRGPGWPDDGVSWDEAQRRCRNLTMDGLSPADTPQDIWRLPTVEEAVRSMTRHSRNSGGSWDAAQARPTYLRIPDKESPLWNTYSKVIYWWTATEVNDRDAYIVVYNGQVWPRPKTARWGYLAFRRSKTVVKSKRGNRWRQDRFIATG